jgi:hypothetical protein
MACAEWYVSFLLKLARAQDRLPWAAMPVFERVGFLKENKSLRLSVRADHYVP